MKILLYIIRKGIPVIMVQIVWTGSRCKSN